MSIPLDIQRNTGAIGAEIGGLDLSHALEREVSSQIEEALYEHKVIFIRGQSLSPEQQIAFSAGLGSVFTDHPGYLPTLEGHPEIVVLDGQKGGRANLWHSDVSISPKPPMGSVLYMKECPATGGDTMWADMTAAYDALSDRMKHYLDGLEAVHDLAGTVRNVVRERSEGTKSPTGSMPDTTSLPSAVHPVVRTHPVTGRKILYVNPTFTAHLLGVPAAEGDAVLAYLYAHQNQPEFQCRWSWRQGDVAIWDNRATHHYAIADYGDAPRTIHRVTLEGEAPF
jgi:taurine dioxygenase